MGRFKDLLNDLDEAEFDDEVVHESIIKDQIVEEIESNVELYDAAPELLEALNSMMAHFAPNAMSCAKWYLSGNSQTDAVLRYAREAIEKARGETNG